MKKLNYYSSEKLLWSAMREPPGGGPFEPSSYDIFRECINRIKIFYEKSEINTVQGLFRERLKIMNKKLNYYSPRKALLEHQARIIFQIIFQKKNEKNQ